MESMSMKGPIYIGGHCIYAFPVQVGGEWGVTYRCDDCGAGSDLSGELLDTTADKRIRIIYKWVYGKFSTTDCNSEPDISKWKENQRAHYIHQNP